MILKEDNNKRNPLSQIPFNRFSLKFPDLIPFIDSIKGDCVSKRRSQRYRNFLKKYDPSIFREELNTILLVQIIENTMQPNPNYPQQYQQAPPMQSQPPSQQEMWAELQRLRAQNEQAQQQLSEAQKKERQATYRVRRARGSGNLSFNWGDQARGAYLTPSKFQDGRVTIAGASMPAVITLQNSPQGPYIVATIQNGPLNPEEVELYNEWFVKPVEVIPARRGPKTGGTGTSAPTNQIPPPQQYNAPAPQQFAPQPQPQYAPVQPVPQYPQTQQYVPQAPQPQQQITDDPMASIRHLPLDIQNNIVNEANTLLKSAPQAYPSLSLAVQAVKRAKNIQ